MSDYIVSARKYRPSSFRSVVGQKNLTNTLKNAIETGRLAQAYLFCGPRGVGKTSCARIFAKTINCLNPTSEGEACGECESCRSIDRGNSYNIIELDAASNNSVGDIRSLTEEVNVPPQVGNYRVFIIDEVHMLSQAAFNAFLKTLEEPPKYVVFILATTEKHKVLPTILSRCQIYDFKRITTADMVEHLQYVAAQEGIETDTDSLNVIARKADGAMRDALSIFDQVAASSMGHITYQSTLANLNVLDYDYYFRLIEAFRAGDVGTSLLILNEIIERGFDILFFINGLASHIRDLMVAADSRTASLLEVAEEIKTKYTSQAQSLPLDWYYAAIKLLNDCDLNYRTATNQQLLVELTLIRLCQLLKPPTAPFDRVDADIPMHQPVMDSRPAPMAQSPIPPTTDKSADSKTTLKKDGADSAEKESEKTHASFKESNPGPNNKVQDNKLKKSRVRSTRLSDLEAETSGSEKHESRRENVSMEKFIEAWNQYIEANGDKPILTAAMKSSIPKQTGEEEYRFIVDHPAQKQAFEAHSAKLLQFIRNKVGNDFVSLEIVIDPSEKIVKPLPQKDLFTDILSTNSTLASLMDSFDPELV